MTRKTLSASKSRLAAAVVCAVAVGGGVVAQHPSASALDAANDAWQRGEFASALNGYIGVSAPGGDRALESIALTTGSCFRRVS
jgi:hypothetical protein